MGRVRFALPGRAALRGPTKAMDRVNITPKKKCVKITIDRELVVTPKKEKGKGKSHAERRETGVSRRGDGADHCGAAAKCAQPRQLRARLSILTPRPHPGTTAAPRQPRAERRTPTRTKPRWPPRPAERPADPKSVTTTTLAGARQQGSRGCPRQRLRAGLRRANDGLDARLLEALLRGGRGQNRLPPERSRRASPEQGGPERQGSVDIRTRSRTRSRRTTAWPACGSITL